LEQNILLEVRDLVSGYGNISILKSISFSLTEGRILALIGANGAGKTTTINSISGIIKSTSGTIKFRNNEIGKLRPAQIVKLGISQVPEGRKIFQGLTVLENLQLGAYLEKNKKKIEAGVEHAYELFPILKERSKQTAGTLSGGEQQMLAIARGLMLDPKMILLDEPSLGLAPKLVEQIFGIIKRINEEGKTILLVEQNAHLALQLADRAIVMETGRIVMNNEAKVLLHDPQVRKTYLGED
jgi:branched-chain amino acid transport system ATP-binding protein